MVPRAGLTGTSSGADGQGVDGVGLIGLTKVLPDRVPGTHSEVVGSLRGKVLDVFLEARSVGWSSRFLPLWRKIIAPTAGCETVPFK